MKARLGIFATHPVQYYTPLYCTLSNSPVIDLTVYYCHKPTPVEQGIGFGVPFQWDIDLTSGYQHIWLKNRSRHPSVVNFFGCDTPEIGHIIRERHFDAFIVNGWNTKSYWQAFRACWNTGTPLIVQSDSQLITHRSFLKKLFKRILYPQFIKRFDICLAYGQRSAEYFRYYRANRVSISPHFVDNEWFTKKAEEARKDRDNIRARWGIENDAFVLLYAGKFEPKKRPLDAIEALSEVRQSGFNKAVLLMVGDGPLRKKCEETAQQKGLPVCFAGFLNQSEMPQAYAASDCLLLCSDGGETWGLVVNEAMACGVPAIVSDEAGCVPDLIMEGLTGYSYPRGDIKELARHMIHLAIDRNHTTSLGQSALKHIQNYSVGNAVETVIQATKLVSVEV